MLPQNSHEIARQITAIYLLSRVRNLIAKDAPGHIETIMLLDKILGEVEPDHLNLIGDAAWNADPIEGWQCDLAAVLVARYQKGLPAKEFWHMVPPQFVSNDQTPPRPNEHPKQVHPDGMVRMHFNIEPRKAPQFGDLMAKFKTVGLIGAEPVVGQLTPIPPQTGRCVKTQQVLESGHLYEMKIDFDRKVADYTLWPPYYGPTSGHASLLHGTILLGTNPQLTEQWFSNISKAILSIAVKNLTLRFPLYQMTANNSETS